MVGPGPKPWLALLLNFMLPGAGLAYLHQWKAAVVNFIIVLVVPLILFFGVGDSALVEHIHYVFLALAAASAGYAHGVARSCAREDHRRPDLPIPQ